MLTLTPIEDFEALDAIYADPWVSKVGHDHRPASPIKHPAARYLGAYVHGKLVGAFLIIESGFIDVDMHALLLRRAVAWSREFGRMCLDNIFANPVIERVNALVLEGLESALNYAVKIGFKPEGFRRNAAMRDGKLVGIYMLGITRAEWGAL